MSEQGLNQAKSKGGSSFEYIWAVKVLSVPCLKFSQHSLITGGGNNEQRDSQSNDALYSASAAMTDSSACAVDLYWIVSLKEQCQPLEDLQWGGGKNTHVKELLAGMWWKSHEWNGEGDRDAFAFFKYLRFFPSYHFKISIAILLLQWSLWNYDSNKAHMLYLVGSDLKGQAFHD